MNWFQDWENTQETWNWYRFSASFFYHLYPSWSICSELIKRAKLSRTKVSFELRSDTVYQLEAELFSGEVIYHWYPCPCRILGTLPLIRPVTVHNLRSLAVTFPEQHLHEHFLIFFCNFHKLSDNISSKLGNFLKIWKVRFTCKTEIHIGRWFN